MKKILIVEDTRANLEAAKNFFSTISGFEFVYATNRKDAMDLLLTVDAVITDRSLPYSETSVTNITELYNPYYDKIILECNGYYLLFKAKELGKPVIMVTEHGSLEILIAEIYPDCLYKIDPNFKLEETLLSLEHSPTLKDHEELWYYGFNVKKVRCFYTGLKAPKKNVKKTEVEAWEAAWDELSEQF